MMSNSFRAKREENVSNKPTRYFSNKQEEEVANAVGGKKTANSGATPWQKGDVKNGDWLFECKTCIRDQKSFTLKEDWFVKILDESLREHKEYSAIVFNFGPDKPNYYVIDEQTFQHFLELLQEVNHER